MSAALTAMRCAARGGPRHPCLAGLVGLLVAGALSGAAAQSAAPLRKSDLVRLLANPMIERKEVAAVVRRNCLAFKPTERDWSDLRSLGADSDIMGSVGECAARTAQPTTPAALSTAALIASSLTARVAATAGEHALAQVQVRRADGTPARGVTLALHLTAHGAGGPGGDVRAVADDSGLAVFDVAVGRLAGRYRLELVSAAGAPLPGRPVIDLVVAPGPPALVETQPPRLVLGPPRDAALGLIVTVRDSLGNALPREPIELRPGKTMGIPADTQATDSLGRVTFVVRRAAVRRSGALEIRARGMTLAVLDAVLTASTAPRAAPVAPPAVEAEFLQSSAPVGLPRTRLADALTLEVRSLSGTPLAGRTVRLQATNAELDRDSAVTDSAGHVQLDVTLGIRAGIAVVSATVDSVRKADTLTVEPGVAVELVLEHAGQRVDGGRILVEQGVPFNLTLRARDRYGNAASAASLTGRLQELRAAYNARPDRLLDLLAVQPDGPATVLTFKPIRRGNTDLRLDIGLATTVSIEVVPHAK